MPLKSCVEVALDRVVAQFTIALFSYPTRLVIHNYFERILVHASLKQVCRFPTVVVYIRAGMVNVVQEASSGFVNGAMNIMAGQRLQMFF